MTTTGKDFPVRSDAFRFSSETRASSAATSPACTECFDIFPAKPGDSDVINQMERLSSKEMKLRQDWFGWRSARRVGQLRLACSSPESVFATSLCQSVGRYPPPHGICPDSVRRCGELEGIGGSGGGFGRFGRVGGVGRGGGGCGVSGGGQPPLRGQFDVVGGAADAPSFGGDVEPAHQELTE